MPIYEYICENCGQFEHIASASEKPLTICPQCSDNGKQSKATKVVSRSAFHLKGGGWYKDLYSGAKPESAPTSDAKTAESATTTVAKSETKTEAKPAGCGTTCGCS